ncbi:hypothetical protein B7C42_02897 [Nocardia cerradoensis]|uniref:Uncharacterized protein n=1 Tax=Nocardia cerradoensis TaxID=85688 RepID=A0A231H821_9NOCA|nr:hypothetical protein [Nocardia cerradoensis]OXR44940.1 hypothetical protein B7C42_02897 [Nocardia cerradoensis]
MLSRVRRIDPVRTRRAADALRLPEAVFKTCPWQPRDVVETGLRQWLRCCGVPMATQLGRTVVAWSIVADPGEKCVLWDLDAVVGVENPWGVPPERVAEVETALGEIAGGAPHRSPG